MSVSRLFRIERVILIFLKKNFIKELNYNNIFHDYATASSVAGIIITEGDKGIKIVKK